MGYFVLTVYLIIGFQFGGRAFFWGRNIRKDRGDFWVPLVILPLIWPVVLVAALFNQDVRDGLVNWDR